jgi:hypothetical protein
VIAAVVAPWIANVWSQIPVLSLIVFCKQFVWPLAPRGQICIIAPFRFANALLAFENVLATPRGVM